MYNDKVYIVWGAGGEECKLSSAVMVAEWNESGIEHVSSIPVAATASEGPALSEGSAASEGSALPNDIAVAWEAGVPYLYVVLNGNNALVKIRFTDRQVVWTAPTGVAPYGIRIIDNKAYVTNWAGPVVTDSTLENAGTPLGWGNAYTNPATGGTARGSLSIIDLQSGKLLNELPLGLHPNAIAGSADDRYLYISNGNSDYISVVDVQAEKVTDSINVGLFSGVITYYGSSPNALQPDAAGTTLYVANGLDNAVCVVKLGRNAAVNGAGESSVKGISLLKHIPEG